MLDIIGKRFLSFIASLGAGFVACQYITDGVTASKYLDFITVISGVYITGQTTSDVVRFVKGVVK